VEHAKATQADQRIDNMSGQVNVLSGRVDGLSGQVNVLTGRVDGLSGQVDDLSRRMDNGFDRVDVDIRALRAEMSALQRIMLQLGGGMMVTFVVGFASILVAQLA
jgi:outer membrane murein-binding lipoprotein Lpp